MLELFEFCLVLCLFHSRMLRKNRNIWLSTSLVYLLMSIYASASKPDYNGILRLISGGCATYEMNTVKASQDPGESWRLKDQWKPLRKQFYKCAYALEWSRKYWKKVNFHFMVTFSLLPMSSLFYWSYSSFSMPRPCVSKAAYLNVVLVLQDGHEKNQYVRDSRCITELTLRSKDER